MDVHPSEVLPAFRCLSLVTVRAANLTLLDLCRELLQGRALCGKDADSLYFVAKMVKLQDHYVLLMAIYARMSHQVIG